MMRHKTSRRFSNNGRENDQHGFDDQEQENNPKQQQLGNYNESNSANDVIADMAQGFIQAQANMNDSSTHINNAEIALLLQKMNQQLDEIKKTSQNSAKEDSKQQNKADTSGQENNKQSSADLQTLLNSVLQGKNNNQDKKQNEQETSKSQSNSSSQSLGKNQQNMINVQTVSQVLAQAQYELANELENSLKKLKQVINESEKLANNISNLLGEESQKQ